MNVLSALLGLGLLTSELWLAKLRRSSQQAGSHGADGGSLKLLWLVIAVAITAGVLLSVCGVGPRLPHGVPWGYVGAAVFAAGAVLRWWAIRHLGRFFTVDVAVSEGQRVVDDGPYRFVRHPSYTGLMLEFAGMGLALGYWPGFLVIVSLAFFALLRRIHVEEAALHAALGEPYAAYARRTKRLVPLIY